MTSLSHAATRSVRVAATFACVVALARAQAPALERGLATIRAESIAADVAFIASDELAGRDTPSLGLRVAALFLKNRLERLGWKPGAQAGWFHDYPLRRRVVDEARCRAALLDGKERVDLAYAVDWCPSPQQLFDAEVAGDVVLLGKVPAEGFKADAKIVADRFVFFDEPGGAVEPVVDALRAAGARGLLTPATVVNTGGDPEAKAAFRLLAGRMREGFTSRPDPRPPLPHLLLPQRIVAKLRATKAPRFEAAVRLARDETVSCPNVVGFWPGGDTELRREVVVLSAHFDHLGVRADGKVFAGADDNGSGTCALLALAEALAAAGPLERSVALVWFSGEELGLWGSEAFCAAPWFPDGAQAACVLNLDMVGRGPAGQLVVAPFSSKHAAWTPLAQLVHDVAADEGFRDLRDGEPWFHRSDQASFARARIPLVMLSDMDQETRPDYHSPSDVASTLDVDKVRRVARAVLRALFELPDELGATAK